MPIIYACAGRQSTPQVVIVPTGAWRQPPVHYQDMGLGAVPKRLWLYLIHPTNLHYAYSWNSLLGLPYIRMSQLAVQSPIFVQRYSYGEVSGEFEMLL